MATATSTPPPATSIASASSGLGADDSRSSDPLKAERHKNNQLEKEIRTLRQQLADALADDAADAAAIDAFIDQFVPALNEVQVAAEDEATTVTEPEAAPAESMSGEVVAGDNSGADAAAPEADTDSDEPAAA